MDIVERMEDMRVATLAVYARLFEENREDYLEIAAGYIHTGGWSNGNLRSLWN